jgi:futalosine hydrolase
VNPVRRPAGRLLVITAVQAESEAVRAGLPDPTQYGGSAIDVYAVGVGPAAAAAGTARLLALAEAGGRPYRAVVAAGVAGGFPGRATIGATVLGTRAIAPDLGAQSPNGFLSLDELGLGTITLPADPALLTVLASRLPGAIQGDVVTVSMATGTAGTAAALARRHPTAVAEGMEGYGVACACAMSRVPFAEVRTISNLIGPRDRTAWRIGEALSALTAASATLAR